MKIIFIRTVHVALTFIFLALSGQAWAAPAFVGNKGCIGCHKAEALDWQRSRHAKAFELLAAGRKPAEKRKGKLDPEKNYQRDEKCVKCHSTGYKQEGGFVDIDTTPDLAGIGCEMCHGPGKEYREIHKRMILDFKRDEVRAVGQTYATLGDKVCEKCHGDKDMPMNKDVDPKYEFIFEDRMKKARTSFHRITPSVGVH